MTLVIKVIRLLLVEVEVTDDEALVPSSATVPAKADWYPAKTSPPAAAVPPATARARRRMRGCPGGFPSWT